MSIKMSECFNLPVTTNDYDYFLTESDGYKTPINCNGMEEEIALAINAYDDNQLTIAKQKEQLTMLRDALESLTQGYDAEEVAHHFGIDRETAAKALAATKEIGE